MLSLSLSFLNFIALGVYGLFPSWCTSLILSHLALPPECTILWLFLELLQLFMSVFALSHSCSNFTSPSSPLSSCFLSLFTVSDSHLGRRANKQFFFFFFMTCCFAVCKTRKHMGSHSHTSTTATIRSAPDAHINPPEPSSVEWLRWVSGWKHCL